MTQEGGWPLRKMMRRLTSKRDSKTDIQKRQEERLRTFRRRAVASCASDSSGDSQAPCNARGNVPATREEEPLSPGLALLDEALQGKVPADHMTKGRCTTDMPATGMLVARQRLVGATVECLSNAVTSTGGRFKQVEAALDDGLGQLVDTIESLRAAIHTQA